jgi:cobalamin synthase
MKQLRNSRAFAPLCTLLIGTLIAGAVAIGHTWADALIAEIVTVVVSIGYIFLTGRDSDVGAIYGQRSDERQREVRANASRMGFVAAMLAAYACAIIAVAMNQSYWQSDVIVAVGAIGFLSGIAKFGVHDERPHREYHGIMDKPSIVECEDVDDVRNGTTLGGDETRGES